MHPAMLIALGHLLVQNAAAGGHPLHVAGGHLALVAKAVAVLHRAGKHVCDGLDPAVWMPGKSRNVIFWILIAEIVQQQERIEVFGFAEAKGALQLHASALDCWLRLNDVFNWAE